jgi:cytoskeletal protein CcmA (bactofilin family)
MDMKISGAGVIGGGEYDEIKISGSAKIEGDVRCKAFHCSGAVHGDGILTCDGDVHVSGSAKVGAVEASGGVHVSGSVSCKTLRAEGDVRVSGGAKIEGSVAGKNVHCSGGVKVGGGIEAESFTLSGSMDCGGLLNAERVEIRLSNGHSAVQAIGGAAVTVKEAETVVNAGRLLSRLFAKPLGRTGSLAVRESIEADDVALVNTACPLVTGARVTIGKGCVIDAVRYSESCEIAPDAKVGKSEKI